jgi:hypothetical protein
MQVEVEVAEPVVAPNGAGIVRSCIAQSEQKVMVHTKRRAHTTGATPTSTDATMQLRRRQSANCLQIKYPYETGVQYQGSTPHSDHLSQTSSGCFEIINGLNVPSAHIGDRT